MRTTLELDDELMHALLARHPGASKRRAVETAIRAYLREDAADRVRALAGTLQLRDQSKERKHDRQI